MELTNDQKKLQSIVKKAWQDPVFKSNLISNPVAVIESFLGCTINLPEGKKSYAVSFILQDDSKTLTDVQIDKIMNKLLNNFETQLGASLR